MRAECIALGLALAAVAAGTPVTASSASDRSLAELAEAYRTVDRSKAMAGVALWDRDKVEAETRRLLAGTGGDVLLREATGLAAVALLTESALLDMNVGDAARARWELQSAARLMEAAPQTARGSAFARRFYLLAGLVLHRVVELEAGHALLIQALRRQRDDPELLTALGAIIETVAALRQYDRSPDSADRGTLQHHGYSSESGGGGALPSASLAEAEARYQQAVALDPAPAEARLRLGRVRLLQGRPSEALKDLERAATEARQPEQHYMARLFEGRAREALGDVSGAAVAYRDATAHAPHAQTALLALAHALDRLGDIAGAQGALDRASGAGGHQDPWWDYQMGQPSRLDPLMQELRRLVP